MADVLTRIRRDHVRVKELFKEFDGFGPQASATRIKLARRIIEQLAVHDRAEEATLYRLLRSRAAEREARLAVLEALEQHALADELIRKLLSTDPMEDEFDAKFTILEQSVEQHIKEEEARVHPVARMLLRPEELDDLGARFEEAKKQVAV